MKYAAGTPEGSRDRLYAECRDRRNVENALIGLFGRRGYGEVVTPALEYYDIFERTGSALSQESMLKMVDRSGRIIVLRPDMTTPIARIAATKLRNEALPQRFWYVQPVFRSDAVHAGRNNEIAQAGIEMIGASGIKADIEVISMAADALRVCGLNEYYMGLGHAGIFQALVEALGADAETVGDIHGLLGTGNFAALDDALEPYEGSAACRALKKLPSLFGGEEVFEEAERYISGIGSAVSAMDYLKKIFHALKGAGCAKIGIDLSIVNQLDYYTGVVFRGYAAGAGNAVLSGGRYDGLISAFGADIPANGFAMDVDAITACLPSGHRGKPVRLIHFTDTSIHRAYEFMERQPSGSCELSPCETLEETLALAGKKGAAFVTVVGDGAREREVRL